jgi:hypothetical protein
MEKVLVGSLNDTVLKPWGLMARLILDVEGVKVGLGGGVVMLK